MSKKPASGTPVQVSGNGAASPTLVAGADATDRNHPPEAARPRPWDPTKPPLGLRLIGTVINRYAREFETFVKVFYEVQCGSERHIMAEMLPKPFDPGRCLAIGATDAWEVWVHTYEDKGGKTRTQITRKSSAMPGTTPF